MYEEDKKAVVAQLATLSLDKLVEFAIEEKLIDGFDLERGDVTILQGDRKFVLPYRQASTFLIGMLRGRSWYLEDPVAAEKHDQQEPDLPEPSACDVATLLDENVGGDRSLEATLDALLTFTQEVGIIRGHSKAPVERLVYIDISACTSVFSYLDAVGYLFDCVQHEVRTMTEAA